MHFDDAPLVQEKDVSAAFILVSASNIPMIIVSSMAIG
jgi:hypothetical protein